MNNLLTEEIKSFEWAKSYHNYLTLREKALKSNWKTSLEKFIGEIAGQYDDSKRKFVNCVFETAYWQDKYSTYIPFNLYHEVFIPVINKWIIEEPENFVPRRWSNDFENLKVALLLSPDDQIGLKNIITQTIAKISMNQHEIGAGFQYDGNPIDDIFLIEFCINYIDNVENFETRKYYQNTLFELKECALRASKGFEGL